MIELQRELKSDAEIETMQKAQDITDKAFAEVLTRIKVGMTEKELQAELIYCLYKNGAKIENIVKNEPNINKKPPPRLG